MLHVWAMESPWEFRWSASTMCGFGVDGSIWPSVAQLQIFIHANNFCILLVLSSGSPCPTHSVLYCVLHYLCELCFCVTSSSSEECVSNGSVAKGVDSTVWRAMCTLVVYTGLVRVLSCLGTQEYEAVKGAPPLLNALWVVLSGFPNQMHFSAKFQHSVDHLFYYVCAAALGHNNGKA